MSPKSPNSLKNKDLFGLGNSFYRTWQVDNNNKDDKIKNDSRFSILTSYDFLEDYVNEENA